MTDTENLKWAVGVLNREAWRHSDKWTADFPKAYRIAEDGGGVPPVLFASEAIAIALALDEQARRKLPDTDQTDWACSALNQRRHGGHARWNTMKGYDGWLVFHLNREYSFFDALAIAESLIRRELLGDTP